MVKAGMVRDDSNDCDLLRIFQELCHEHFDGFLDAPSLRWNARLRSSAGRFVPGSRKHPGDLPPAIEVATYLRKMEGAEALIRDTIAHEMIHYWLWVRGRPYGHTEEFMAKMRLMGVSRYNPVPRLRPYRYVYACVACDKEFLARRKLGLLACTACCQAHAGGKFDSRFKLFLKSVVKGSAAIVAD